jgi:hypothetical protein
MAHTFPTVRIASLAGAALLATSAFAGPLSPGGITPVAGTTALLAPDLAGTSLISEVTPFSFTSGAGLVSGEIRQIVVRSVDTTLDFYWQITNNAGRAARLNTLDIFNFITDPTNLLIADYLADSLVTQGSNFATRTAGLCAEIGFVLHNGVGVGESSHWLMLDRIERERAKIGKWMTGAIGGGFSDSFATDVPTAPVPEPGSSALLVAGLGFVGYPFPTMALGGDHLRSCQPRVNFFDNADKPPVESAVCIAIDVLFANGGEIHFAAVGCDFEVID